MNLYRQTANTKFAKENKGGSINLNSLLIPLATVGGLIIGIGLNQVGRDKGFTPVDLVGPIKPANASPSAPLKK